MVSKLLNIRRLVVLLVTIIFVASGCTRRYCDAPDSPLENFEALWKIIDEKYCYLEEKGVDWDSIYTV